MRFTIRSLLIGTLYVAVGCAALVQATETWTSIVVTLTVATLLTASVIAVTSRSGCQAYYCGVAVVGIGYLAVVFAPGVSQSLGPQLATTKVLEWAMNKMHGDDAGVWSVSISPNGRWLAAGPGSPAVRLWDMTSTSPQLADLSGSVAFIAIGHCQWALILGCLGGLLGQLCYVKSNRREKDSSPIASPVE